MEAAWTLNLLLHRPHLSPHSNRSYSNYLKKCAMATFILLKRCYQTIDRYDKEQTLPLETSGALRRLFENAYAHSLASFMAWDIKATLLCAHSPTVFINPEPCSASAWDCPCIKTSCDLNSAYIATYLRSCLEVSSSNCDIYTYKPHVISVKMCVYRQCQLIS